MYLSSEIFSLINLSLIDYDEGYLPRISAITINWLLYMQILVSFSFSRVTSEIIACPCNRNIKLEYFVA